MPTKLKPRKPDIRPELITESPDKPEKSKYSTRPLTKKKRPSKQEKMESMGVIC